MANIPEAEKNALELVSREKTYGPIYDVLYNFYFDANRVADAENILKLKVANNPKQASYIMQLAGHYERVKKPTEVRETLQKLLDDPKDFPEAQLRVGDFYLSEKDYPQAVQYYQAAQQNNPKDKVGLEKRAMAAMLAAAKYDDAMREVNQILRENPKDEIALAYARGLAHQYWKTCQRRRSRANSAKFAQQPSQRAGSTAAAEFGPGLCSERRSGSGPCAV